MTGTKFKLTYMGILALPLLFHLLLVGGGALLSSAPHSAAASSDDPLWHWYLKPQQQWPERASGATADLAPLPVPPTQEPNAVALGERLFHDPALSGDGTVSCSSCHKSSTAFADQQRVSPGVEGRQGKRNAQSLLDVHLWQRLFWDNRAGSLEEQARGPLEDPNEMDSSIAHAVTYVRSNYEGYEQVDWWTLAAALAAYQRTLTLAGHPKNRLDQFLHAIAEHDYANARKRLSTQELEGLHLFRTKAGCVRCHNGPLLSDQQLHVTGLHYYGRTYEDLGAWEQQQHIGNLGAFRTPMLRDLMASRPWMHNGLFNNMKGIINFYRHGGARVTPPSSQLLPQPFPAVSDKLVPFELTREEQDALLAFLQML
ncbi:cytochrome-c peroxidase [Pseudidiomarina sediminum]|uniref:cytochrome-c peroxidase n=1 Tax=Pseudidiomarina sediminum TaxID=431675 RepID=UPI001C958CA2|nr:cytochrome c peroxidase [Pseudidiomarina sediminum]MBY6063637.1 cytochrome-c peroxidase [Pseudidiomarina sediminum]